MTAFFPVAFPHCFYNFYSNLRWTNEFKREASRQHYVKPVSYSVIRNIFSILNGKNTS